MAYLPNEMNDSPQIPLDDHDSVQESSTQLPRKILSINTEYNWARSRLTMSLSDRGQDNAVKSSNGSRHSCSSLIDVFNNSEPANMLEISKVSQQKEYKVNASSTLQLGKEVETREKFFIKSRTAIENPSSDVLDLSIPRTNQNICPDCGNAFTPKTKMDQGNVVLGGCNCKRKVISQSSSNRAMITHSDVTSVSDPSHSQQFISNKKHRNLHGKKLICERNTCTNNAPEVTISIETQHHKHSKVLYKPYVKKHPRKNSYFITPRDMPGNSSRKYLESEVSSSSELKGTICQECGIDFMCKSKLKQHSVVHTGEKPFVCEICQKAYTQKGNLTVHKKSQHPETFQMRRPLKNFLLRDQFKN